MSAPSEVVAAAATHRVPVEDLEFLGLDTLLLLLPEDAPVAVTARLEAWVVRRDASKERARSQAGTAEIRELRDEFRAGDSKVGLDGRRRKRVYLRGGVPPSNEVERACLAEGGYGNMPPAELLNIFFLEPVLWPAKIRIVSFVDRSLAAYDRLTERVRVTGDPLFWEERRAAFHHILLQAEELNKGVSWEPPPTEIEAVVIVKAYRHVIFLANQLLETVARGMVRHDFIPELWVNGEGDDIVLPLFLSSSLRTYWKQLKDKDKVKVRDEKDNEDSFSPGKKKRKWR